MAIVGDAYRAGALFPPLRRLVHERGLGRRVVFLGPVEDTAQLMGAATAFVFPSLYEGFGLPPLEAMACGTPVVCSNATSLPEVVGDAAVLFDPRDVDSISTALRSVLEDGELRREMRARGLTRAAQFDWRETARRTLAAYHEAAGRQEAVAAPTSDEVRP